MSGYRISQLAERSGVPASTLRFYETAGLLSAERTSSGYRMYDDAALARLAFIGSAKHLGLPLDEIRELLGVWERGICAQVREQLLPLVGARIADAEQRIAELSAFSAHLAGVHEQLSGPAPAGACAPGCGCVSASGSTDGRMDGRTASGTWAGTSGNRDRETSTATSGSRERSAPVSLELTHTRPGPLPAPAGDSGDPAAPVNPSGQDDAWRSAPVTCSLTGPARASRVVDWHRLLASATAQERVADGLRIAFPPGTELAGQIARLAAAEQDCCSCFDFSLHLTPDASVLTVRAPEAASDLLAELLGAVSA